MTNPEDVHNWSWKKDYIGDTNINFKYPEVSPVPDPDKTSNKYFKFYIYQGKANKASAAGKTSDLGISSGASVMI